jgi:hypothetical protein
VELAALKAREAEHAIAAFMSVARELVPGTRRRKPAGTG